MILNKLWGDNIIFKEWDDNFFIYIFFELKNKIYVIYIKDYDYNIYIVNNI